MVEEQALTLAKVCGEVPVIDANPPAERERLIERLLPGDLVIVCEPSLLGLDVPDAKDALERILKSGASVQSIEPAVVLSPEHALSTLAFVSAISAGMRRTRRVSEAAKAGRKGIDENQVPNARRDWFDLTLTRDQVAGKYGVSWRTLYRQFGPREANP